MRVIYFDMDGTIADLYGYEGVVGNVEGRRYDPI